MSGTNPLEMSVSGFTAVYNRGPDGFAVGGYSSRSPDSVREFSSDSATITNMQRARWIARTFHDWDIASEHKLNTRRMRGDLTA